jgi:hypothetical protein
MAMDSCPMVRIASRKTLSVLREAAGPQWIALSDNRFPGRDGCLTNGVISCDRA